TWIPAKKHIEYFLPKDHGGPLGGTWIPAKKHIEYFLPKDYDSGAALIEYFIPKDYDSGVTPDAPESLPPAAAEYEVLFALTASDKYRCLSPTP
ncbi:hypothetical protein T484DRAFT_1862842, partial [Baffinella frigidus]